MAREGRARGGGEGRGAEGGRAQNFAHFLRHCHVFIICLAIVLRVLGFRGIILGVTAHLPCYFVMLLEADHGTTSL